VVVVGSRKALAMAVRNGGARRRWSKLREWLLPDRRTMRGSGLPAHQINGVQASPAPAPLERPG